MRLGLLLFALVSSAIAAGDAHRTWRDAMKRLDKHEKKFWDEIRGDYNDAVKILNQPYDDANANPKKARNPIYDFSEIRKLYEDYEIVMQARAKADLALAASGHEKAFDTLFHILLDAARRIDQIEVEHLKAAPTARYRFDQRPGVERTGLAIRVAGLVDAFAKCPDAAARLAGDGLKDATKKDGRRSIVRRVAVIDALGPAGAGARDTLAGFVDAPQPSLRIACGEALIRLPDAREQLAPQLDDKNPIVRRALLQAIHARAPECSRWIGPVLSRYKKAAGVERAEALRALTALTGQPFGDAPGKWDEWFEEYRAEIEGGKFDRKNIEVQEDKPKPLAATATFFGVPTASHGVVYVFEATRRLFWPADFDVQNTRYKEEWNGTYTSWGKKHTSHHVALVHEFDLALEKVDPEMRYGLVALHGRFGVQLLGEKKLLRMKRSDLKKARKMVERLPGSGYCSQYAGLVAAATLAGMPPDAAEFDAPLADTVFLFNTGAPYGGRYMSPPAALAAFRRFNRFRRLVVHAIRFCDEGTDGEELMKGLAESSGGQYLWVKKPRG